MDRTEYLKANNKRYYAENRERRKKAVRERQIAITNEIQEFKKSIGCSICGYNKSAKALQFHHSDDNKDHNVSRMCAQGRSREAILEEIAKCICVCANCHAEIHDD